MNSGAIMGGVGGAKRKSAIWEGDGGGNCYDFCCLFDIIIYRFFSR